MSALRAGWSFAQPLLVVLVYALVFRRVLRVDGGGLPYLSFIVTAVVMWRFFAAGGLSQSTSLLDNAHVLSRIYFRREVIPLAGTFAAGIDLGVGTAIFVAISWAQGTKPSATLLALVPVYAVLCLYTASAAVLVATVTVFVRDVAYAMPTVQQLVFFGSPIMYSSAQIPHDLRWLRVVNPLSFVFEAGRDAALRSTWPSAMMLAIHGVVGSVLLVGSIAYLRAIEHRIVDVA